MHPSVRANTIDVISSCTRQCERSRGSPQQQDRCRDVCTAAMSVLNKSFNFSPALAATHSRIEVAPPVEPDDEGCVYNDPAV